MPAADALALARAEARGWSFDVVPDPDGVYPDPGGYGIGDDGAAHPVGLEPYGVRLVRCSEPGDVLTGDGLYFGPAVWDVWLTSDADGYGERVAAELARHSLTASDEPPAAAWGTSPAQSLPGAAELRAALDAWRVAHEHAEHVDAVGAPVLNAAALRLHTAAWALLDGSAER